MHDSVKIKKKIPKNTKMYGSDIKISYNSEKFTKVDDYDKDGTIGFVRYKDRTSKYIDNET